MGRILAIVLGLGVVVGVAYYAVTRHGGPQGDPGSLEGKSAPKQTLDNVHRAADRVTEDMAKRAREDDQMQKAAGQ